MWTCLTDSQVKRWKVGEGVCEGVCCRYSSPAATTESLRRRDEWIEAMNKATTAWALGLEG